MNELTPCERTWIEVIEELRRCPEVTVYEDRVGGLDPHVGDASAALAELAEHEDVRLSPALRESFFRFEGLSSSWGTEDESLSGEFSVDNIRTAVIDGTPLDLWHDPSPEEVRLQSQLRAIDASESGSGWLAAIRIQPGVDNPEVWFDRTARGYWKLDVDYAGYLAALRVTKGARGWQYLFADVDLRGDDFERQVVDLRTMLDVFPDLFPGHDYEPLRIRLRERTSG